MLLELPTVSIIVFAYDEISCFPATLNSILQQTYAKYEVLVFSDDGGLVKWSKGKLDSRLKFIFQRNLGISQTLNQGISTARGEYISFLVAGDLWHPHKLQKQVFYLDYYPDLGLIHSWQLLFNYQGRSANKVIRHQYDRFLKREISAYDNIALSSVTIRNSCLEVIGLFDPKLQIIPDWDLWMRLGDLYQCMTITESLVYCQKYHLRIAKNFRVAETDLQTIIEKTYARATFTLLEPKNRSYGRVSLFLAAKVLQNQEPDPAIADNYCRQALQHYPLIGLSAEFLRLRLAIIFFYCLESDRYSDLRQLIQTGDSLAREVVYQMGEYFPKLLDWMLEEDGIIFGKHRQRKIRDRKLKKQE